MALVTALKSEISAVCLVFIVVAYLRRHTVYQYVSNLSKLQAPSSKLQAPSCLQGPTVKYAPSGKLWFPRTIHPRHHFHSWQQLQQSHTIPRKISTHKYSVYMILIVIKGPRKWCIESDTNDFNAADAAALASYAMQDCFFPSPAVWFGVGHSRHHWPGYTSLTYQSGDPLPPCYHLSHFCLLSCGVSHYYGLLPVV